MRLPRRRTVWLSAALLLAIVVGSWLLVPRSRITQANFDRIQEGMSEGEVKAILGNHSHVQFQVETIDYKEFRFQWCDDPNSITITLVNDKVFVRDAHIADTWETLTWYAKKGASKVGIKWQ